MTDVVLVPVFGNLNSGIFRTLGGRGNRMVPIDRSEVLPRLQDTSPCI